MVKRSRWFVALLVSAVFLWLAFRKVNGPLLFALLAKVQLGYVLLFLASAIGVQLCRIFRWGTLVRPLVEIDRPTLFRIASVGLMMIVLLPFRLGEMAVPYLLRRECGIPMASGLASVAVERTLDGLFLTLFFFAATFLIEAPYAVPEPLRIAAFGALALFSAALAAIVAILLSEERATRVLRAILGRVSLRLAERVLSMLASFVRGLAALPDKRAVVGVLSWTLAYWVINGLGFYSMMRAFGWALPTIAGFLLVCVVVIGVMIPAGPGFLGTYQTSIVAGLAIFGINDTEAAAFGLLTYPISLFTALGFGLFYLLLRKSDMAEVVRAATEA